MIVRTQDLPAWLPASSRVDLAQLALAIRPAMRSRAIRPASAADIRKWARSHRLFAALDRHLYFVASSNPRVVSRLLAIDLSAGPHVAQLGLGLGYPECCRRAAARVGEGSLDAWATELASRRFVGLFQLTNPGPYARGASFISHIPCSPRCNMSLNMALRLRRAQPRWCAKSAPETRRRQRARRAALR